MKLPPRASSHTFTTPILHDLGLLTGIEPRRRADYKSSGFEGVLADVNFRLLREQRAGERSGIQRRVDLEHERPSQGAQIIRQYVEAHAYQCCAKEQPRGALPPRRHFCAA
jgi:hypothetical protein